MIDDVLITLQPTKGICQSNVVLGATDPACLDPNPRKRKLEFAGLNPSKPQKDAERQQALLREQQAEQLRQQQLVARQQADAERRLALRAAQKESLRTTLNVKDGPAANPNDVDAATFERMGALYSVIHEGSTNLKVDRFGAPFGLSANPTRT